MFFDEDIFWFDDSNLDTSSWIIASFFAEDNDNDDILATRFGTVLL